MSRGLRGGAPRLLGRHDGASGRLYNKIFGGLARQWGPFDEVTRFYAGGTAALGVAFQQDTQAVNEAELARRDGKGRRPSASAIARLKKRQGLSWHSYDSALRRLEELTADRRRVNRDPLAAVRAAVKEASGR